MVRALQPRGMTTLDVKGMDAITSLDEIKAALERECNVDDCEVTAFRPMRDGYQAATIKIDEDRAKKTAGERKKLESA